MTDSDKKAQQIELEIAPKPQDSQNQNPQPENENKLQDVKSSSANQVEIIVQNEPEEQKANERKLQYSFYIFVNPKSGGNKASILTKIETEKMTFSTFHPKDANVQLSIFSLIDSESRIRGLKLLKAEQENNKSHPRVIVGGGDGTIMWVVEEMIRYDIDFKRCPIGTIPFGTGNDFSRVTGWGPHEPSNLIGPGFKTLKKLMTMWVDSVIEDFDIWDITIECYKGGGIRYIDKPKGQHFKKMYKKVGNTDENLLTFNKKMSNYFSFGVDSRTGYGFDKRRTASRCCNLLCYTWEGFKKMFTKTKTVNELLVDCQKVKNENGQEVMFKDIKDEMMISGDDFLIYPSNAEKSKEESAKSKKEVYLKKNYGVFLCHNIPSYMAGTTPWGSSRGKIGSVDQKGQKLSDFQEQNFGDSKLEILGFGGPLSLGFEKVIKGRASRLYQASGPFEMHFKEQDKKGKDLVTYMQIDGEYYSVVRPKSARVQLAKEVPTGKIRVMVNKDKTKS